MTISLTTMPAKAETAGMIHDMLLDVRARKWERAEAIAAASHDRFTTKLYDWLYYTEDNTAQVEFSSITTFIRVNPEWPRQPRLRLTAERAMPPDLPDGEVVAWFKDHAPQTPQGEDHYIRALLKLGQQSDAAWTVNDWWRTASLTNDQQEYFLHYYSALIERDSELVRMDNTLSSGAFAQGQALASFLGGGYPAVATARIALLQGRSDASDYLRAVPEPLRNDPPLMLDHIRYELREKDDYRALELMHDAPPYSRLDDPEAWWQARSTLTRHLLESKQYESAYLLVSDHGLKDGASFADAEFLAGWLALRFMHQPVEAFKHFQALYLSATTAVTKARGAYWAGQASAALGYTDTARQWYQTAAQHQTTFYGQMAIGELKDQFRPPQQQPPAETPAGLLAFDSKDMVRAAVALNSAGMNAETTEFLDALADGVKTPEEFRLTAELAEKLGHPQNAVRIAKKGLNKNILLMDQLFPTILSHMKHVTIEWALAHALIRQESTFDVEARSPVGALGLMQVMPATAEQVAHRNDIPFHPELLASDPDYNIELGSMYFKQLLDRYDNSYPLAIAAYNAGPHRVDQWLDEIGDPRHDKIALTDWIELIPISETRNYVQRVLEGVYIYRLKLHGAQRSYYASGGANE